MKKTKFWSQKRVQSVLLIAFFNFILLTTEFCFDNCMAKFCDAETVVMAQNIMLGVSVIGFVLYGVIERLVSKKYKDMTLIALAVVFAILAIGIKTEDSSFGIVCRGVPAFIILGVFGGGACYFAGKVLNDRRHMAKTVGIAYAFGILIQYLNSNLVRGDFGQLLVLVVMVLLFDLLLVWGRRGIVDDEIPNDLFRQSEDAEKEKATTAAIISLIITVALMTCIFSMLDNAVTLVHASGDFNIGQWPRLILALSGLAAGFVFDLGGRRFMDMSMYFVTVLSVIAVLVLTMGGSFLIGLMMFYLSAGFFVVFFMTSFMDISVYSKYPEYIAGLGRAVNNLCALLTSAISVMLLSGSSMTCLITTLVFLALISGSLRGYRSRACFLYESRIEESMQFMAEEMPEATEGNKSPEEYFVSFVTAHDLTAREAEVLAALLSSEDNVQDLATELAISRAALYRHIAAIQEKTGTKSRMGIVRTYYEEKQ